MEDFKAFVLDAINRNNKMIVNKKKLEVDTLVCKKKTPVAKKKTPLELNKFSVFLLE